MIGVRERIVVLCILVAVALTTTPAVGSAPRAAARPNVVVIMTDDQTVEQMRFMPRTQLLLGGQGTTYTNSYVNWPLCCPSRATFLTGQYAHNHQVDGNGPPPHGGYGDLDHTNTLPVWLQRAGYVTGHIGKYLHGYGVADPRSQPPGWTEWYGSIDFTTYRTYDYRMNRNGTVRQYGHTPADYQTDVWADDAVSFINRRAPGTAPFFLNVATLAPHRERKPDGSDGTVPIQPAPRHAHAHDTLTLPRTPSFNEADVGDKPGSIRSIAPISPGLTATITDEYRNQAESLLAVDELVQRVYNALKASGELDKTIIVFTSDNGYFHGEHRVNSGKNRVYEPSIRVPLLVRGPGFAAGRREPALVINADLAPTIVESTGATAGVTMDGRSLRSPLAGRALLIETANIPSPYTAIHTGRWVWVEYKSGERELYDLAADPDELESLHAAAGRASVRSDLARHLAALRTCRGATCR